MNELRADNLHLWRGEILVLCGISFIVSGGQCLQVTGVNGAGKTSLLRALCGLVPLELGEVSWRGRAIGRDREAFHADLAYLGHENGLKADLTAAENLHYSLSLRCCITATQIRAALEHAGLPDGGQQQLLRHMSAGQRRRVALARTRLAPAALWVLDEPTANLDSAGRELVGNMIEEHLRAGGTAVIATHQPLQMSADRVQQLALE